MAKQHREVIPDSISIHFDWPIISDDDVNKRIIFLRLRVLTQSFSRLSFLLAKILVMAIIFIAFKNFENQEPTND